MHLIIKLISTSKRITMALLLYYYLACVRLCMCRCEHIRIRYILEVSVQCFRLLLLCVTFQFFPLKRHIFPCCTYLFIRLFVFILVFHILFSFHFALISTFQHILSFILSLRNLWIDHHLKSGSIGLRMIFSSSFDFASHLFIYLFILLAP